MDSFTTNQGNYLDSAVSITEGSWTDTINEGDAYYYYYEAYTSSPAQLYVTLGFDASNDFDVYIVNDLGYIMSSGATFNNPEMAGIWTDTNATYGLVIFAAEGSGSFTLEIVFDIALSVSEGLYTGNTAEIVYYSIEVDAESGPAILDVYLTYDYSVVDFDLYIYEGFGSIVASSEDYDDDEEILLWVTWTTTYVIAVYPYDGGTGSYSLEIEVDQIDVITDGTTNGYLANEEVVFYAYDILSTTSPLQITFDLSFSSSVDYDLALMDLYGEIIATSEGTTNSESLSRAFYAYGTIVVVVYSYSGSGDFSLTIESSEFTPGETNPNDSDDPNDNSTDTVSFTSWLFMTQIIIGIALWTRRRK